MASRTGDLLQACFECHQPAMWIFGHHHRNWRDDYRGTDFICLKELGYFDFNENGKPLFTQPK